MEIGAVKQAFNNELILLKKKLNQAKTQIIHKLTRKAKQLTEKKNTPEALKEKFKKKAENAVKEVLFLKKIKARDIGRFIVTHKGNLQEYLNKPQVDNDKACARILLHKAMQEKYKLIRNRFSNIPIKDLFMSRNERLKLKKEEKMRQKEKRDRKKAKNEKNNVVNAEGDWDVEDVEIKKSKEKKPKVVNEDDIMSDNDDVEENMSENDDNEANSDKSESDDQDMSEDRELQSEADSDDENSVENDSGQGFKISFKGQTLTDSADDDGNEKEARDNPEISDGEAEHPITKSKRKPEKSNTKELPTKNKANNKKKTKIDENVIKPSEKDTTNDIEFKLKIGENKNKSKQDKKHKESNKNKNLQDKIRQNKFKKDTDETHEVEKKVVDPFFVTASGENYMSVFEPRQPDEIKEVHKQGNRAYRRAVMFGNVPKNKPRPQFREENTFDRQNAYGKRPVNKFDQQNGFSRNSKFNDKDDSKKFNNRFDDSKKRRFNDRNDRRPEEDSKPEKLHPSWEAKKKRSGILPFQGKKIVFDES